MNLQKLNVVSKKIPGASFIVVMGRGIKYNKLFSTGTTFPFPFIVVSFAFWTLFHRMIFGWGYLANR